MRGKSANWYWNWAKGIVDKRTKISQAMLDDAHEITLPFKYTMVETTYESLCEGGSSCTVDAGKYIVINHTTSTRTYLDVGPSPMQETPIHETPATINYDLPADSGTTPGAKNISIAAFSDTLAELTKDVIETGFSTPITEIEIWRNGVQIDTLSGWGVTSYTDWNRAVFLQ